MEQEQVPAAASPPVASSTEVGSTPAGVTPLLASEAIAVQAFKDATTKAIDSADGACGTILTASFSIVTAYGAAVALVAPKDDPSPMLVLTPFIAISIATIAALVGKAGGVKMSGNWDDVGETQDAIQEAVRTKRVASWAAVVLLALGMVVAGWVLFEHFGQSEAGTGEQVVGLTVSGQELFDRACAAPSEQIHGDVSIDGDFTTIVLAEPGVCAGTSSVTLPSSAVAYVRKR